MELEVPTFNMGSPKQRSAANKIRQNYIQTLVDKNFDEASIQTLLNIRCVAKWWLDNREDITVANANKLFKSAERQIKKHGSVEAAVEHIIDQAYKAEKATAEYLYNSAPMYRA